METPLSPMPDEPKKSNTPLIIGAVVALVLCCCCISVVLLWQYGDALLSSF